MAKANGKNGFDDDDLMNRYHRRKPVTLSAEVDEPVVNQVNEWVEFVASEVGVKPSKDEAIEDIISQYLNRHTKFQDWRKRNKNNGAAKNTNQPVAKAKTTHPAASNSGS